MSDEMNDTTGEVETGEDAAETVELMGRATYHPADNKLRFYPNARLSAEDYARIKAAGFSWAPQQEIFVAGMWTPGRADLMLAWAGDIEDEDYNPVERAEDRAERFGEYSEKRASDAQSASETADKISERFYGGQPILVGHHSEKSARRDHERADRATRRALKLWETSEYWTSRAANSVWSAKYKELPAVRARRIKTIEASRRKALKDRDEAAFNLKRWQVAAKAVAEGKTRESTGEPFTMDELAKAISNSMRWPIYRKYPIADYPRKDGDSLYEGDISLWSALDYGWINGEQAMWFAVPVLQRMIAREERWIAHYDMRLAYERAMLDDQGGLAVDRIKPEIGGAIAYRNISRDGLWLDIVKVNKVTVTVHYCYNVGGRVFLDKVPFDRIKGVMTAAEVREAVAAGRTVRNADNTGFYLGTPIPAEPEPVQAPENAIDPDMVDAIHAMAESATDLVNRDAPMPMSPTQEEVNQAVEDRLVINPDNKPFQPMLGGIIAKARMAELAAQLKANPVQVVYADGFYPTPPDLARQVAELADIHLGHDVLEPSAGTGNLVQSIFDTASGFQANGAGALDLVEINGQLVDGLRKRFPHAYVSQADFLDMRPDDDGSYDRIIMNPPFTNGVDIKHILHARKFLKPSGRLVAICANGPRQQAALKHLAAYWKDIEGGTFEGTGVRSALLVMKAEG